jgi:hypothetical protein
MRKIYSIFGKRELQELAGNKRYYNWIVLFLICLLTMFTLGSALNIKEFLRQRMDSPFVQMVAINVPFDCKDASKEIVANITRSLKSENLDYNIESSRNLYAKRCVFKKEGDSNSIQNALIGCVKDENEILWRTLADNKEHFITDYASSTLFKDNGNGGKFLSSVIITQDFAKKIFPVSYDELIQRNTLPAYILYESRDNAPPDSIPISAIVKSLPCGLDALTSADLYICLLDRKPLVKDQQNVENYYWMSSENYSKMSHTDHLDNILPGASFSGGYTFYFGGNKSALKDTSYWHKSMHFDSRIEENHQSDRLSSVKPHNIIISFSSPKNIRNFAEYITEHSRELGCPTDRAVLGVDLSLVKSKENIDVFNGISIILLISLAIASLILIVNYCISILRMHIEKNRANLGTLKAFGFSNKGILKLYASVTSALLGSAFIMAYLFTYFLGNSLLRFILDVMDLTSKTEGLAFSNIPLYYSLPLFVIAPVVLILFKVKGILQLTPGALVFQRENQ